MKEEIKKKRMVIQDESVLYCDICSKKILERDGYNIREAEIYYKEGESYPDCVFHTTTKFDICFDCMKNKIIPLISKEFNIETREEEYDW